MSKHTYFYPVKQSHLVPMQELWNSIKAGEKSTTYFPKFKRDMIRAGELHLPQERQVRAWAKDVVAGVIPLPSAVGDVAPNETSAAPDTARPHVYGKVAAGDIAPVANMGSTHAVITATTQGQATPKTPRTDDDGPNGESARKTAAEAHSENHPTLRMMGQSPGDEEVVVASIKDVVVQIKEDGCPIASVDELLAAASSPIEGSLTWETGYPTALFSTPIEPEVTEEDPVRDAVDIIVNHYQERAFAKARKEAANDAARALRHFADKVEASA